MSQLHLNRIVKLLDTQRGIKSYTEQTGGGIATIYVGEVDDDGTPELMAGPGQFTSSTDTDPLGDTDDFYISPDCDSPDHDDPELNYTAKPDDTEEDLTNHIAEILHIRRHRAGLCCG